jgi:hypothetical protein
MPIKIFILEIGKMVKSMELALMCILILRAEFLNLFSILVSFMKES